jgi:hypothetical protein
MTSADDLSAFRLGDLPGDLIKVLGGSNSNSSYDAANKGGSVGRFWAGQFAPS